MLTIADYYGHIAATLKQINPAASSADLSAEIKKTATLFDRDWQEFRPRAVAAIHDKIGRLESALDVAIQRERDGVNHNDSQ